PWPDDITLKPRERPASGQQSPDDFELVKNIHAKIVAEAKKTDVNPTEDYTSKIPLTEVEYQMVAIPGGKFVMGSPEEEEFRRPEEGPQVEVAVDPFWMGRFEV